MPPAELVAVEPGPSSIAGRGLHAARDVATGEAVVAFAQPPGTPDDLGLLNHSCDPTLVWRDATTLVARADLPAGAELTLDYATVFADPAFVLWCHCGTYRCRQVIEGGDWRIPQLRVRYAGEWSPAVQRLIDAGTGSSAG